MVSVGQILFPSLSEPVLHILWDKPPGSFPVLTEKANYICYEIINVNNMGGYEEHLCFMSFLDNYVQKRETPFF